MRNYSVVYVATAVKELASIWEIAPDRAAVTKAADDADRVLAGSPQKTGILLGEELWKLDVAPLRFYFAIRDEDRIVEVSNVIRFTE
jgi:hypothetical protein